MMNSIFLSHFTFKICHLFYSTYATIVDLKVFNLIFSKTIHCIDTKVNIVFSKKLSENNVNNASVNLKSYVDLNIFHMSTLIFSTLVLSPTFRNNCKFEIWFTQMSFFTVWSSNNCLLLFCIGTKQTIHLLCKSKILFVLQNKFFSKLLSIKKQI